MISYFKDKISCFVLIKFKMKLFTSFLFPGDKFMSEFHLKEQGFT